MVVKVAINGFGRIGRISFRTLIESEEFKNAGIEVVAINDLGSLKTNAHLLKYDSVHDKFSKSIETRGEDTLIVDGKEIKIFAERDPKNLPWKELDIDIVYECTGIFTERAKAMMHIEAGAKKVLISAPSPDADLTVVYGVNHRQLTKDHLIVSNASCTTNCLAPVAYILQREFGIERAFCTTVHAYTADQSLVDTSHKDLRRARAAALSMIPSSTGAAKTVGVVLPELKGKIDGVAIRVPTPNTSLIDLTFTTIKPITVESINAAMIKASQEADLKGVLAVSNEELVSMDFNHTTQSSTFDLTQTQLVDGKLARILAWYDNELGFSTRMSSVAGYWAKLFK
jgi:glyceraldehyde 3-phosphate dehydrogenase